MSLLVIQFPPRDRLGERAGERGGVRVASHDAASALRLPAEWSYVLSADGRAPTQVGQAALALLPKADQTVLLLAEADVSWHAIAVPKAPAARMRAALAGVMEDALLEDEAQAHLALADGSGPGRKGWVAVTDSRRLTAALAALEGAGRSVERVLPAHTPGAARGHFHVGGGDVEGGTVAEDEHPWLSLAGADGVVCLRLSGGLARAVLAAHSDLSKVRWTATPSAAQAAEQVLGRSVPLMGDAQRALEAAASSTNLRQFELAPHHRGTRVLREGLRRLFTAEWRPVRVGLLALVVMQLVGLNAYAWQQGQALANKRQAMTDLLQTTHPSVRTVLDAPLQMQRETDRLRAAAGRAGAGDFEALLAAAAAAWPDGMAATPTLRFEPGSLTLAANGWAEPQMQQFRERLRNSGYTAQFAEGRLVLTRAANKASL